MCTIISAPMHPNGKESIKRKKSEAVQLLVFIHEILTEGQRFLAFGAFSWKQLGQEL